MVTLIQELVKRGKLDKKKAVALEYEIKNSGRKEEEVILEQNIVSEKDLFSLKSEILKMPLKEPILEDLSVDILKLIPEDSARFYKIVPLSKKEKYLEIGAVYPEDLKVQQALKFLTRRQKISCKVFLITPTSLREVFKKYRTLRREVRIALEELETELETEEKTSVAPSSDELSRLVEEAPISKVVAVFLRHAVEGGASDIHVEPGRENLRVRFRLDGVLHSSIFLPLRVHLAVLARIKILSRLKIDETRIPQDGRFSAKIGEGLIDFRVSTFPTNFGEKACIRVLNPEAGVKTFKEIGLQDYTSEVIREAISKPFGMILATGPTGCGKSTTLYSILRILNQEGVNITTLEDPIEYYLEGINQSQIRPDIGYSFASGLRSILRQDPDIIMVGEIRDAETASLATHAALTGHIVLSTLHTNNALGVIPRLTDLEIESYLIPPSLSLALAQRLVRRLCPHCKRKIKAKEKIEKLILGEIEKLPNEAKKKINVKSPIYIYEPVGCKKCRDKGYIGRIAVVEVLKMTDELADMALKKVGEGEIAKEAHRQGMITIRQDGILKVLEGLTSIEEIVRVAEDV